MKSGLESAPIMPSKVLEKITKKVFGLELKLDDVEKDSVGIKIGNFGNSEISGECLLLLLSLEIYDCAPAYFYKYFGPVKDKNGKIVRGHYSAHIIQGTTCHGQFARRIERHGYTPAWFPISD